MVKILEELGFTTGAARAALARLVNRGLLARVREGRQAFYSLTERADALLSEGDRRIFGFGRNEVEPEAWTVLWHAIPEDQRVSRSQLASRLRFLGFGTLQDSTWIAARDRAVDVRQLLEELGIVEYVSVVVGRMSQNGASAALVAQAWRLGEARRRYELFLTEFSSPGVDPPSVSAADAFRTRTLMLHSFRGFPFVDPELPDEIDSVGELRSKALTRFDEIYTTLEQPANAYFWETVQPSAS